MEAPKKWTKITLRHSSNMAALHQQAGVKIKELIAMYPQYSPRSIYRHAKQELSSKDPEDRRKYNKGRPPVLSLRDKRKILRAIPRLRRLEGSFNSARLAVEVGLAGKVNLRTIRKFLNKSGYHFLQARKKGLLTNNDLRKRVLWCRRVKRHKLGLNFWTKGITFYLDGKGFAWKKNPQDQACAPKSRIWRKRGEGLEPGCTAKAGKAGVTNLNFMVGISHGHGVVLCERYFGSITGDKFANIVKEHFPSVFQMVSGKRSGRILQDNCPRQNSGAAKKALDSVNGMIFTVPPRSPDLNCIENFFALVSKKLESDAKKQNITNESKEEFEDRIKRTMSNFSHKKIDSLIESMPRRVDLVLKNKGKRINY